MSWNKGRTGADRGQHTSLKDHVSLNFAYRAETELDFMGRQAGLDGISSPVTWRTRPTLSPRRSRRYTMPSFDEVLQYIAAGATSDLDEASVRAL